MAKLTLTPINSGYASTAALNSNFDLIEAALEKTVSRDGTTPNTMENVLDMNGYSIINQGNPINVSGMTWEGPWVTTRLYSIGDIVEHLGTSYICIVEHTSNVFSTDLSTSKWQLFAAGALPEQVSQSGKFLSTNGTSASWEYAVDKTSLTGSAQLPVGTTAERDGSPADGYFRLNSTLTALETWYSAAWNTIATTANAVLTTGAQIVAGIKTFSDGIIIDSGKKINFLGTSGALQIAGTDAVKFNAGGTTDKLQSVTCTQATGALTFGLNPTVLDFRSTTLTTGVPVTRNADTALSLVLPSGGTLGAVTTVQARLILVAIDNAGTVELAVVNLAGGNSLSEEGVINTTAIAGTSDSNNVFYSTTARTGVAYRVVGAVDVVNTAGAWASPVLVQPMGGEALSAMSSLGYGQTWQAVTRTSGTTYYNTTNKAINIAILLAVDGAGNGGSLVIGGISVYPSFNATANSKVPLGATIPHGFSYVWTNNGSSTHTAVELR